MGPGSDQIILLVLDFTSDLSLVDAAKQALMAEISKLPANAWVGLLRDQDGLHVLADPSPNRQPLLNAIKDLATMGKPGLFETVSSGAGAGGQHHAQVPRAGFSSVYYRQQYL